VHTMWFLDIDGPINGASRCGWHAPPRRFTMIASGPITLTIRYSPELIERIRQADRRAEVVWCSTWCGFPADLKVLSDRLGLHLYSSLPAERPAHLTWGDLKTAAVRKAVLSGARVVWTDDDEVDAARNLFPELREAERDGRALLIQPDSNRGLRPEDMDRIDAFITAGHTCPACPQECPSCTHDMADCECYDHQNYYDEKILPGTLAPPSTRG